MTKILASSKELTPLLKATLKRKERNEKFLRVQTFLSGLYVFFMFSDNKDFLFMNLFSSCFSRFSLYIFFAKRGENRRLLLLHCCCVIFKLRLLILTPVLLIYHKRKKLRKFSTLKSNSVQTIMSEHLSVGFAKSFYVD